MTEKQRLMTFICSADTDKQISRKLHDFLKQHGVQPFSPEDIPAGSFIEDAINKAMDTSQAILIIVSKEIEKAGDHQKQIKYARELATYKSEGTVFIIPIYIGDLDGITLPVWLRKLHPIIWSENKKKQASENLLKVLQFIAEKSGYSPVSFLQETDPELDLSPTKQDRVESLPDMLRNLRVENENLRILITNLSHLLESQSTGFRYELDKVRSERDDAKEQALKNLDEINRLESKNNQLNDALHRYEDENERLLEDIKKEIEIKNKYLEQIRSLKNEKSRLETEEAKNKSTIEEQKRIIAMLEQMNLRLESEVKKLTSRNEELQNQIDACKVEQAQSDKEIELLNHEIDDLKNSQKFNGLSFGKVVDLLHESAVLPPPETIQRLKNKFANTANDGSISYMAIEQYLKGKRLIDFYWVFSRLIDYGISKTDAESIPAIHSNLKRLIDLGLVHRESKDSRIIFTHTESGKNFLLRFRTTRDPDPIAKEIYILG